MVTSLLEFYFSKHYFYDNDNRFKLRVLNANILNNLEDNIKAKSRFKQAMSYLCLEKLDSLSIGGDSVILMIGEVYFKENNRIQIANLSVDKSEGNIYVAVISNDNVVTLLLMPNFMTNQDIFDKVSKETGMSKVNVTKMIDLTGKTLKLDSKERNKIIIDLDKDINEFNKEYPSTKLKNNPWSTNTFSKEELNDIEYANTKRNKDEQESKVVLSASIIPDEFKQYVIDKEFVIYDGMKILIKIGEEYKWKTIRKLVINEKGDKREFSLEFENTLKPMILNIGTTFVISPNIKNEELNKLKQSFNIDENKEISFVGQITKFNFYSKQKTKTIPKLGVIINPRLFLDNPAK